MISIYYLLDWRWINALSPFIGLIGGVWVFYSHKTCTKRKAVSTAVLMSIMLWLMLVWADWGSVVFVPSYQSMWSRVILLTVSTLIIYELRRHTIQNHRLKRSNEKLTYELKQLKRSHKVLNKYVDYLELIEKKKIADSLNKED